MVFEMYFTPILTENKNNSSAFLRKESGFLNYFHRGIGGVVFEYLEKVDFFRAA